MKSVTLSNGMTALVDDEDFDLVSAIRWHAVQRRNSRYAQAMHNGKTVLMHRLVMSAGKGRIVDHINGNGLDNRRENLRFATTAQNRANSNVAWGRSQYRGVCRENGAWVAMIGEMVPGRHSHSVRLGRSSCEEEAAMVYDMEILRRHGRFSGLNFPELRQWYETNPTLAIRHIGKPRRRRVL